MCNAQPNQQQLVSDLAQFTGTNGWLVDTVISAAYLRKRLGESK